MIEIKEIPTEKTFPLRLQVLWPHLSTLDDCLLPTDNQAGTFHLGVIENGEVKSIGTFLKENTQRLPYQNQYRLRAMATHPQASGKGYGKQLIKHAIAKLQEAGVEVLWCDARKNALPFYQKLNFLSQGEAYIVPRIGWHKFMYYPLKNK